MAHTDIPYSTVKTAEELMPLYLELAQDSIRFLKVPPRTLGFKMHFVHTKQELLRHVRDLSGDEKGVTANPSFTPLTNTYGGTIVLNLPSVVTNIFPHLISPDDRHLSFGGVSISAKRLPGNLSEKPEKTYEEQLKDARSQSGNLYSLATIRAAVLSTMIHEMWHLIELWQVARDLGSGEAGKYYGKVHQGTFDAKIGLGDKLKFNNVVLSQMVYKENPMENAAFEAAEKFTKANITGIWSGRYDRFMPMGQLAIFAK